MKQPCSLGKVQYEQAGRKAYYGLYFLRIKKRARCIFVENRFGRCGKRKGQSIILKEIKEREGREKNKDDDLYEKPSEEELRKVRQLYG